MTREKQKAYQRLFESRRLAYEKGVPKPAYEVAMICLIEGLPVPEWAVPVVKDALERHFRGEFRRGSGNPAPFRQSERERTKAFVVEQVAFALQQQGGRSNLKEAYASAAGMMNRLDPDKHWTAKMIENIYFQSPK